MAKARIIEGDTVNKVILEALMEKKEAKLYDLEDVRREEKEIIKELKALDTAINQMHGRVRSERSDKGKKRKRMTKSPLAVVKNTNGRLKPDLPLPPFNKDATFQQKVVFAITQLNRFVFNREIAEFLYDKEQTVSVDILVERLSARASRMKKDGAFVTYLAGGNIRNTVYGLSDWLDTKGDIKPGYEYNEKYLLSKQKEAI